MIAGIALFLALAGASPLDEAARALAAGRLGQAAQMIAAARSQGITGEPLLRLEADHALASGATQDAYTSYKKLLLTHPADTLLLERAALAALRLGLVAEATSLLDRATLAPAASWRAWNLRGVAADLRGDFDEANSSYARASSLAPKEAAVLNNKGWSLMLQGRWAEAEAILQTAVQLDPKVSRGAANLELAQAAVRGGLPARLPKESDEAFAARLNDVGVIAAATGDKARAIAAFTRAIDARSDWFARAAKNLAIVSEGAQ
jgi:Flp pilus assembly protein TadD